MSELISRIVKPCQTRGRGVLVGQMSLTGRTCTKSAPSCLPWKLAPTKNLRPPWISVKMSLEGSTRRWSSSGRQRRASSICFVTPHLMANALQMVVWRKVLRGILLDGKFWRVINSLSNRYQEIENCGFLWSAELFLSHPGSSQQGPMTSVQKIRISGSWQTVSWASPWSSN